MTQTILGMGPGVAGVQDTLDPGDDPEHPNLLQDAQNGYVPDVAGNVGFRARPGFLKSLPGVSAITAPNQQAVAAFTYTANDGTVYRFIATNGKMYRFNTNSGVADAFASVTDVTPVGVTIDNSLNPSARFYFTQHGNQLIFHDSVNRPWRGTNLGSTPITGNYIDIDGANSAWTAQGRPVVWKGALFFIVNSYAGAAAVQAGVGIVWSEPNQPSVGYCQTNYADFWNLIEQSSEKIYCLAATNTQLFYFRENSIGGISGTPGSNLSTTATTDSVSPSVGSRAPDSIVLAPGGKIFFVDRLGRPWAFTVGRAPQPLWKQLQGQIDANPTYLQYPNNVAQVGVGSYVPVLNCVVIGAWSSAPQPPGSSYPPLGPTTLYCFDADTGVYFGRWSLNAGSQTGEFNALAVMKDYYGTPMLGVVSPAGGTSFSLWYLSPPTSPYSPSSQLWTDYDTVTQRVPAISVKTQRLGYSDALVWNASDNGVVVTQSTAPLTVTVQTPNSSSVTEITAQAPNSSADSTYRMVFGMNILNARGISVTITPTTASSQWVFQSVHFPAASSPATTIDP